MMFWDKVFSEDGFAYGLEPNGFLAESAHLLPDGPILCVASGEGRNAVYLALQGREVHGVDASRVGVAKTRQLAVERGVRVQAVVADLAQHDLGQERWAGIVSIFGHLPAPLRTQVHAGMVRALRPGGVLLMEAYTPRQLHHGTGGPPVEEMLYEPAMLREELAGLELDRCEERVREVREGKLHSGLASVVQVIGVKQA
jgi:SAM-dependent methyltransferase